MRDATTFLTFSGIATTQPSSEAIRGEHLVALVKIRGVGIIIFVLGVVFRAFGYKALIAQAADDILIQVEIRVVDDFQQVRIIEMDGRRGDGTRYVVQPSKLTRLDIVEIPARQQGFLDAIVRIEVEVVVFLVDRPLDILDIQIKPLIPVTHSPLR